MSKELTRIFDELENTFRMSPRALGFSPLFNELRSYAAAPDVQYPKYNIVKIADDQFQVEVAAAGFSANEIDVEVKNNILIISGQLSVGGEDKEYIHRGVAKRNFTLDIKLGQNMEVGTPYMTNGLLTIPVTRVIPEAEKPRKIPVLNYDGNAVAGTTEANQ